MRPILQTRGLKKCFVQSNGTEQTVLEDVAFSLSTGEVTCLLGASGSGKTTLLRILAGLDFASGGCVETDIKRPGQRLGYLSQNDRLLPWRSVQENVALGLDLLGEKRRPALQAATDLIQAVGLDAFATSKPSALSGGMEQRALLARTLSTRPLILLMDEPMSNLDVLARQELALLIRQYVRKNDATALVVTHSVEEACFLGDRILLVTRSPARIFREIRLSDGTIGDGSINRESALDAVMKELLLALGTAAS